jgi:hypothetical protein
MLINFACLFTSGVIDMTFELRIFRGDYGRGRFARSHLRFAVLDSNKSKSYPSNFVSLLPMRIDSDGKFPCVFTKFFGTKSLETARGLLTEALRTEDDSEIKAEMERRLNLLEPNPVIHIKCLVCKKFYQTQKERARKQRICPECIKIRQKRINRNLNC